MDPLFHRVLEAEAHLALVRRVMRLEALLPQAERPPAPTFPLVAPRDRDGRPATALLEAFDAEDLVPVDGAWEVIQPGMHAFLWRELDRLRQEIHAAEMCRLECWLERRHRGEDVPAEETLPF